MSQASWSLEVVRGKHAGRVYPLGGRETVLGNSLNGSLGIDLSDQEGDAPRRMAGRHASLALNSGIPEIRDLDSPGGTFVNRKRILPGQAVKLAEGDVVQIGPVQLKIVAGTDGGTVDRPGPAAATAAFPYRLRSGQTCRGWDDFLAVSSQRWADLRAELESGRLDDFARGIGRADLASFHQEMSADERLDAWLGKLPATKPANPELDVHPASISVRGGSGGAIRRSFRISNVGYRLLRAKVRVEAGATDWLTVTSGTDAVVIDEKEVGIEIRIPEGSSKSRKSRLIVEGPGGPKYVEVNVSPARADGEPEPGETLGETGSARDVLEYLEATDARNRIVAASLALVGLRFLIALGETFFSRAGAARPDLIGPICLFALIGGGLGAWGLSRRGGSREIVPGGISGACAGIGLAAIAGAACRAIEPILGDFGGSLPGSTLIWAAIGAGLAALSTRLVPHREKGANA